MALTLVSLPANISNSGVYNITTNLVEDATHVNLRVRADITIAAVIVATVEKPKGLADFDFFDILKSLVPGFSFARDSGAYYQQITGNGPLVAYTVVFTEVWETTAGVTTTGDTDSPAAKKFVPAIGDGTAFTEYVLHDANSLFANKTLRNNICKFFTVNPVEYWLVFFTEIAHVELFFSKDGGDYDHSIHFDPTLGWGAIIINRQEWIADVHQEELMAHVTSNLRIQLGEVGGAKISEVLTIYVDNTSIAERTVLEFDGLVGGKEYLAFEGLKDLNYETARSYYIKNTGAKGLLSSIGKVRQKLETRFKDMANADYLKSLLISEKVTKLNASYIDTDVTVITDSVKTDAGANLFVNQIEIEY